MGFKAPICTSLAFLLRAKISISFNELVGPICAGTSTSVLPRPVIPVKFTGSTADLFSLSVSIDIVPYYKKAMHEKQAKKIIFSFCPAI